MGGYSRCFIFNNCRKLSDFVVRTVEGCHYIATSADWIMSRMYTSCLNYASNNLNRFHALTQKYYNIDDSAGYFLDLGANIGTSGIYFTKKIAPNLKLLAFEPDNENCKLHRINLMLNDMESSSVLVNCGLGNKMDELTLYKDLSNPGHNNFTDPKDNVPTETVKVLPLDSYLAENNIAASEVKYIWIDTEGFEPQVLLGAKNLLKENPAPIFMECNLKAWDKFGYFEDMMTLLSEGYSHFIFFGGGKETIYQLEELRTMKRPANMFGNGHDILLIKKGAVV